MVATGLGGTQAPKTVVDNSQLERASREGYHPTSSATPQVLRTQAVGNTALAQDMIEEPNNGPEMERILNIPAFLRRQAD